MSELPPELKALKLDSLHIVNHRDVLARLPADVRRALLPEARRQEALRWKRAFEGRPHHANWTVERWAHIADSYLPSWLIDDPPWPTEFQHRRLMSIPSHRFAERGIEPPADHDWVFVIRLEHAVDPTLPVPLALHVAVRRGLFFVRYQGDSSDEVECAWYSQRVASLFSVLDTPRALEALDRVTRGNPRFEDLPTMTAIRLRNLRKGFDSEPDAEE